MNITAESYGHAVILVLKGDLTADSLDMFRQAVKHQLAETAIHDVVLNMEGVPFVDSAALEYLLDLQEQLAERLGQVKLLRVDENVAKILEMTRLDATFERFDQAAQAVKTL